MNWSKAGVLASVGCLVLALVTLEVLFRTSGAPSSAWRYVPIVLLSVGLVLSGWFNWRAYQADSHLTPGTKPFLVPSPQGPKS